MRKSTITAVTALAVVAMTVTGAGLATAMAAGQPVGQVSASANAGAAQQLRALHDQLATAQSNKDVAAARTAVAGIGTQLRQLRSPYGRVALSSAAAATAGQATDQDSRLAQALAAPSSAKPASAAADPLATLGDLINQLLSTLISLVNQLLGSVPSAPTSSSSSS